MDTTGNTNALETLRERFEKDMADVFEFHPTRFSKAGEFYIDERLSVAWRAYQMAYQSCAEDNQAEIDKYKAYHDAVLDHCVINHLPEKETPYKTIGNLCDFASEIALDPQVSPKAESLYQEIENMKRKLEDNQYVVELPKEPAGKWGDRKYSVEQVIAAIKASGARVKQ